MPCAALKVDVSSDITINSPGLTCLLTCHLFGCLSACVWLDAWLAGWLAGWLVSPSSECEIDAVVSKLNDLGLTAQP
ncbi:unnamed protein product [Protopolystoma xenopodis]|uniref:Uncharacterized protein n=1 Tax=Protopolystoma xenopodis TaxID=117903 RepID=A0A448XLP2_9PLAT|nr:unnamed protein product [Protopolystoma xenopodis]